MMITKWDTTHVPPAQLHRNLQKADSEKPEVYRKRNELSMKKSTAYHMTQLSSFTLMKAYDL